MSRNLSLVLLITLIDIALFWYNYQSSMEIKKNKKKIEIGERDFKTALK